MGPITNKLNATDAVWEFFKTVPPACSVEAAFYIGMNGLTCGRDRVDERERGMRIGEMEWRVLTVIFVFLSVESLRRRCALLGENRPLHGRHRWV